MPRWFLLAISACVLAACTHSGGPAAKPSPFGSPTIEADEIARHAEQFDDEIPDRPAGSQQEFAAATYVTAHLQRAGYVVELDPVPVSNAVRSTNVVALPPSGGDPSVCVVVGYDSGRFGHPGISVAAFLELARALRVAVPDHSIEFVAMGAEQTDVNGGALGARRLIRIFEDRDISPAVVEIYAGERAGWKPYAYNDGPVGNALFQLYLPKNGTTTMELGVTPASDWFDKARLDYTIVTGEPTVLAKKLLGFLRAR